MKNNNSICEEVSVQPCICYYLQGGDEIGAISCDGKLKDNNRLPQIMDNLTKNSSAQKHFCQLYLYNTQIQELKENTIKGITFDRIFITYNENLTTIHEKAFNGTENITKLITISRNDGLSFKNISIFEFLTKFINLEKIKLESIAGTTEIPTNAFGSSFKNHLESVRFGDDPVLIIENSTNYQIISRNINVGKFNSHVNVNVLDIPPSAPNLSKLKYLKIESSFTKVNSYAFSSLDNLVEISFKRNSFETIAENAFSFDHASNKSLKLKFYKNYNVNSFNEKSLLNINRPTKLNLENFVFSDNERYLEEEIFLPFLLENPINTIYVCSFMSTYPLRRGPNGSDQRNHWFMNNTDLEQKVSYCSEHYDSNAYFDY